VQSAFFTDFFKILIQLIHDDDWVICFFTDYIKEILAISKIGKDMAILEMVD